MNLDEEIIDIFVLGIGQTPPEFVRKIKQVCAKHYLEEIEKKKIILMRICANPEVNKKEYVELNDIRKVLGDDKT